MKTGVIVGIEKGENRDGENKRLLLSVEISDPDDVQIVELILPFGLDVYPPVGSKVFLDKAGESYKICMAVDDGIGPNTEEGESIVYSVSEGAIVARTYYKNNGDIEIESVGGGFVNIRKDGSVEVNGDSDFMVRFSALQTAFNQLKSDFDTHIHSGVVTGGSNTSVPTATSSADIDPAKIDNVKTN
jgi:hypothetical protein